MIQVYLRQAWQLLKQNKVYSTVYIVGSGLAIAMTMTIAIIYYVKIAPVYPEMNRNRMLAAENMRVDYDGGKKMLSSNLSWEFVREHLYTLQTPEAVSAVLNIYGNYPLAELTDGRGILPVSVKYTDDHFWKVFDFRFIDGRPFTEEDFRSAIKTAVVSSSLANRLFGTTEAEGKTFSLDGNEYRVAGVVHDVSYATPNTYAQAWVPFTVMPEEIQPYSGDMGMFGSLSVYMLAPSVAEVKNVIRETEEVIRKINAGQDGYIFSMAGQPEPHWKTVFHKFMDTEIDWSEIIRELGIILLALLIIPAVNMAGMVSSRMEKRLPEMGVRKSFGASRGTLMKQILTENMLLTLMGGAAGLLFSYLIVYGGSNWILTILESWPEVAPDGANVFFTAGTFFNPVVFLIAFIVCFILNYLSAVIPAYYGLRKDIVYSLSSNR